MTYILFTDGVHSLVVCMCSGMYLYVLISGDRFVIIQMCCTAFCSQFLSFMTFL